MSGIVTYSVANLGASPGTEYTAVFRVTGQDASSVFMQALTRTTSSGSQYYVNVQQYQVSNQTRLAAYNSTSNGQSYKNVSSFQNTTAAYGYKSPAPTYKYGMVLMGIVLNRSSQTGFCSSIVGPQVGDYSGCNLGFTLIDSIVVKAVAITFIGMTVMTTTNSLIMMSPNYNVNTEITAADIQPFYGAAGLTVSPNTDIYSSTNQLNKITNATAVAIDYFGTVFAYTQQTNGNYYIVLYRCFQSVGIPYYVYSNSYSWDFIINDRPAGTNFIPTAVTPLYFGAQAAPILSIIAYRTFLTNASTAMLMNNMQTPNNNRNANFIYPANSAPALSTSNVIPIVNPTDKTVSFVLWWGAFDGGSASLAVFSTPSTGSNAVPITPTPLTYKKTVTGMPSTIPFGPSLIQCTAANTAYFLVAGPTSALVYVIKIAVTDSVATVTTQLQTDAGPTPASILSDASTYITDGGVPMLSITTDIAFPACSVTTMPLVYP